MNMQAARILASYSDELEIREDSPTRGQRTTTALYESREWSSENQLFAALAEFIECADDHDDDDRTTVAATIRDLKSDQMGRSGIVWY